MLSTFPQQTQVIPGSILTGWTIRRYESFQECPSYHSIIKAQKSDSYQKRFGVHILFKQSQDGSIIIGDTHEYAHAADPEKLGFDVNNELNEYVIEEAKRIFALESWKIKKSWLGFYSQSSKGDIFQQTIDQNIHIVTGIGGKGMTASFGFAGNNMEKQLGIKPFT
jgi:glycine/D-amino acid oxidase-like deaminating enzyme